jgi:hypothetical protein
MVAGHGGIAVSEGGYPSRVNLKIGERYVAAVKGEGEFVVMLLSPASPKSFSEAGGTLVVPMWHVRRDDGHVFRIEEAALQALPSKPGK